MEGQTARLNIVAQHSFYVYMFSSIKIDQAGDCRKNFIFRQRVEREQK